MVGGRISDVVYLGSMTQSMVDLATGDSLTVHRLNDEATTTEAKVGDTVTLHWAAANSFVIKGVPTIADRGGDPALDTSDNHNGRHNT
jgi:hypothetical protein